MPEEYTTYKPEWIDKEKQTDAKFASFVMTGITKSNEELRRATDATRSARPPKMTIDDYVEGVLAGDRMKLSRAITMVESNAPKHYTMAQDIVQRLLPYTGKAIRVGITGVPGAGKSTIIEALGTKLCQQGHKVAVLAVDPSSSVTGGAILGDKTRMEQLAKEPNAFIRPSPAGGTLGGVTRKSRETMLLAEAAGYDIILVETVGVGQSETTVRSMVDFFLVVVLTGAGDDLQGVKKGVIELADAILVNKADGDNLQKALLTRADYEQILHYLMPATEGWTTKAYTCSAYTGEGIQEIWDVVLAPGDDPGLPHEPVPAGRVRLRRPGGRGGPGPGRYPGSHQGSEPHRRGPGQAVQQRGVKLFIEKAAYGRLFYTTRSPSAELTTSKICSSWPVRALMYTI